MILPKLLVNALCIMMCIYYVKIVTYEPRYLNSRLHVAISVWRFSHERFGDCPSEEAFIVYITNQAQIHYKKYYNMLYWFVFSLK